MVFVRKPKRVFRSPITNESMVRRDPPPMYSTPTMRVMEMPEYQKVIEALSRGVSVTKIVDWFEREGWLGNMSPSTLTQYLYKFKVERSELLKSPVKEEESYDHYVGNNIPDVDELVELDKLIMIQKRRISTDIKTELGIGKLLDTTHKEIGVMGELLKAKRQMRNNGQQSIAASGDNTSLREMRVSEDAQDRMQSLTTELFNAVKGTNRGISKKTRKTQKVRV